MQCTSQESLVFTRTIVADLGALADKPLRVIDIGAYGGVESHWEVYDDQIELIAFEPNEDECSKLNEAVSTGQGTACRFYPTALHRDKGRRTLHVSQNLMASSLLETNWSYVNRFPHCEPGRIVSTTKVNTADLDSFLEENEIDYVDFMKIDAEGCELAILEGARGLLAGSLLGVSIEVFFQAYHRDRPLFSDIDEFLRGYGFALFDLPHLERWRRNAWTTADTRTWYSGGQLMWAQALYLRDPVGQIKTAPGEGPNLDRLTVLKLASLAEVFGLDDVALELLHCAGEQRWLAPTVASDLGRLLERTSPANGKGRSPAELNQTTGRATFLSRAKRLGRRVVPNSVRRGARKLLEAVLRA